MENYCGFIEYFKDDFTIHKTNVVRFQFLAETLEDTRNSIRLKTVAIIKIKLDGGFNKPKRTTVISDVKQFNN